MKTKYILFTTIAGIVLCLGAAAFGASAISADIFSNGGTANSTSASYMIRDIIAQDITTGPSYSTNFNISAGRYDNILDSDNDGMPDQWEVKYTLDPYDATGNNGADGDPDNDGQRNYLEYQADTDPKDGESIFKISTMTVITGTGVRTQIPTREIRKYNIYYSNDAYSNSLSWTLAQTIDGTDATTSWTDNGTLTGGSPLSSSVSHRYYKFSVTMDEGWVVGSAFVVGGGEGKLLLVPRITGLRAIDTALDNGGSITVTWDAIPEEALDYYRIYRSTKPITEISEKIFIKDSENNSYIDKTTTDGVNYYYAVTVMDANGNESKEVVSAGPVSSIDDLAPSDISNISSGSYDRRADFSWSNPIDSDFCGVKIMRKTNGYPANINEGEEVYNIKGVSFIDSGLTNGVIYYYTAFTYDEIPNYSNGVNFTAIPKDSIPPSAPTGLKVTDLGGGKLSIIWNANSEYDMAGYFLYNLDTKINVGNVTEYKLKESEGTIYTISVSAYDTSGNESDKSSAMEGTVGEAPLDTTSPAKVTGLRAYDTPDDNGGSITLTWEPNSEADVAHYNIYRSAEHFTDISGIAVLGVSNTNSYTDNTTVDKTEYYYAATAVDTSGNVDTAVTDVGPVFSMDNLYY